MNDHVLHYNLIDLLPEDHAYSAEDTAELEHQASQYERLRERFIEISKDLEQSKVIGAPTAATLRNLGSSLESINSHFNHYPVATYTQIPSSTNLTVTQEGLLKSIKEVAIKAIKAIWKFIVSVFNLVGDYYATNARTAKQTKKTAQNVVSLSMTNGTLQDTLNAVLSGEAMLKFNAEHDTLLEETTKAFNNRWTGLLKDMVADTQSDTFALLTILPQQLKNDADLFMQHVGDYNARVETLLKGPIDDTQVEYQFAGLSIDILTVHPEITHLVEKWLKGVSVKRGSGISEYQAAYVTTLSQIRTLANDRSHRVVNGDQLVTAVKFIHGLLDKGYLDNFNQQRDALLKVFSRLRTAEEVSLKLTEAGVDPSEILQEYRSMAQGIQAMQESLKYMFNQFSTMVNLVSTYEQKRLALYNRYIADPTLPSDVRKKLVDTRDELRRTLIR